MKEKHFKIIENLTSQGKRKEALFLLDSFESDNIDSQESDKIADLKARILIHEGEITKAKEIWNKLLESDKDNPEAKEGLELIEKIEKDKFYAFRIFFARFMNDNGKLISGLCLIILCLLFLVSFNSRLNKSLNQVNSIKTDYLPGGNLYEAMEKRFSDLSMENAELKKSLSKLQLDYKNGLDDQKKTITEQFSKQTKELQLGYSSEIESTGNKFFDQLNNFEGSLSLSQNRINKIEKNLIIDKKQDSGLRETVTSIKKDITEISLNFDKLKKTSAEEITQYKNSVKKILLNEKLIAKLEKQNSEIEQTVDELKRQSDSQIKIETDQQ